MTRRQRHIAAIHLLLILVLAGFLGGPANGIEPSIMAGASELRSNMPALAKAAAYMTILGGLPFTMGAAAIASLYLLGRKQWGLSLLLIVTAAAERLLVDNLKDWIGRPRPPLDHLPTSLAYPSGHAANSMTAFLAVALLAVPARYRRLAAIAAVAMSLLIGLTRIVLGVHWPSDVVGGWALGLLAIGIAIAVGERSGVLHLEAKHDVIGGHLASPSQDEAA